MKSLRILPLIPALAIILVTQTTQAAPIEYAAASAGTYGGTYITDTTTPTALASIDPNNFASASIKSGGVGVGVSTNNPASTNYAEASWQDTWTANSGAQGSGLYIAAFRVEGSFSPGLSDAIRNINVGSNFGGWFDTIFDYKLGELNGNPAGVHIELWSDGGSNTNNVTARWKQSVGGPDIDLVSDIVWGTNALGNTTFVIDVRPVIPIGTFIGLGSPCASFPCTLGESMSATMALDGTGGLPLVMADFLHTFTADVQSTDPNAVWTSEGGRQIGAPVGPSNAIPEPQTLALLGLGLCLMGWRSRRRGTHG